MEDNQQNLPSLETTSNEQASSFLSLKRDRSPNNENSPSIITPNLHIPLVNLSLYTQLQSDPSLTSQSISESYEQYKQLHFQTKINSFYNQHKNDEWFKEKYDLYTILQIKPFKDKQIKKLHNHFIRLISRTNNFANINLTLTSEYKTQIEKNSNIHMNVYSFQKDFSKYVSKQIPIETNDIIDIYKEPFYAFDTNTNVLILNEIPNGINQYQILTAINNKIETNAYLSLNLSQVNKQKNYSRHCWIYFSSNDKMQNALTSLHECKITDDFMIFPYISPSNMNTQIRITPKLFKNRFHKDMQNIKDIITLFDEYYNNDTSFPNNKVITLTSNYPEKKQFDILLLYLRYVYGFCLYCVHEEEDSRELAMKCDCIHLRDEDVIEENEEELYKEESEYDKMLDMNIEKFKKVKQWEISLIKTNIENEIEVYKNDFLTYHVKIIEDGTKYQCGICNKLFIGKEYVITHINNKHVEIMKEMINKVYYEEKEKEIYFQYKDLHKEEENEITSLDEYNSLLENKKCKRNDNKYKDYDSIENRKKHEITIIHYDDL